ncbi:MAG: class I SAM-dependent methyltransferase [Ignavibacteriaceae bacterium]
MANFWIEHAKEYSERGFEINNVGTHPAIINLVKKYKVGAKILDYGCGDGTLLYNLGKDYNYSIYDISEKMLELANIKLNGYNLEIHKDVKTIPQKFFDVIILSMVLICIDNENEINSIMQKLKESKTENGIVIIAIPHPCFRDQAFSSYFTEFSIGKEFNYFNNGQPHKLFIRDKNLSFTDHNWTLSHIINSCLKSGLNPLELVELKDNNTNTFYNSLASPSLIIVCK